MSFQIDGQGFRMTVKWAVLKSALISFGKFALWVASIPVIHELLKHMGVILN
jgi:hypothetical protein